VDKAAIKESFDKQEMQEELRHAGLPMKALSGQQEKFIHYVLSGMSDTAAAQAVGTSSARVKQWLADERFLKAFEYFRSKLREQVVFDIHTAHQMYMDAYAAAVNSTEMKMVIDSLVKLHGVAVAPKPQEVNLNIRNVKHMERMSDAELLAAAKKDPNYLLPPPIKRETPAIDAEFSAYPAGNNSALSPVGNETA